MTKAPLFLIAFLSSSALWAQQNPPPEVRDIQQQVAEPERRKEAQAEIDKTVDETRRREAAQAGPEVTYEQVMADPDNIELNYRYALSRVGRGDLRAAASTLERILMVKKDLPKVKLLYAVILYRLDNLEESERLLAELKKEEMPASLRAELNDYISQIRSRRRRARLSFLVGSGLDYDENRNAAPATGRRLFLDTPIALFTGTRQSDIAAVMMANIDADYDLGFQAGHKVFAGLSYYRSEQADMSNLNLQVYGADVGFKLKGRWGELTPSFGVTHLLLAQTTYMRGHEAKARFERKFSKTVSSYFDMGYGHQEYNRTQVVPTGPQRSGDKFNIGAGLNVGLSPAHRLSLGFDHSRSATQVPFNSFNREAMTLSHTWLLGKGMFMLGSAAWSFDFYDRAEVILSRNARRDETIRGRATFGLPMSLFWKPMSGFTWTASYEYFRSLANIESYGYTNNKISTMFTYKWAL
ncbi:MAG: tetratricopeptide repeat protein [Elusimicrobia bacterium]|nr:tetratricopeptide repeat protein [Elusimicrobiota bacterium]